MMYGERDDLIKICENSRGKDEIALERKYRNQG